MCVHVNRLDSLAVDHHRQALAAAALLSPRGIRQPTTAENDTGRGAGTLEKIPARVHVRLPVDHFDRTSPAAGRHPQSRNFIRLPQQIQGQPYQRRRARGGAARSHAGRAASEPLGLQPKCRSPEKRHLGRQPMRKSCVSVAAIAMVMGIAAAYADPPVDKPVTKKDPALDALVSSDAKLEEISTGYGFTEGLVWVAKGKSGYLLLSDMPANVIYKLSTDGKEKSLYLDHSGYTGFDI